MLSMYCTKVLKKYAVFGAEFVAIKHGIEKLRGLLYKLCMMGIPLTGPSYIYVTTNHK